MSEILPRLYLGGLGLVHDLEFLRENKITHIVSVIDENILTVPMVVLNVKQLSVRIHDCDDAPIAAHFDRCVAFIQSALEDGGAVLVHCFMGVSRSPTIVAAYLMRAQSMAAAAALEFLVARRPIVDPNDGFRAALAAYDR